MSVFGERLREAVSIWKQWFEVKDLSLMSNVRQAKACVWKWGFLVFHLNGINVIWVIQPGVFLNLYDRTNDFYSRREGNVLPHWYIWGCVVLWFWDGLASHTRCKPCHLTFARIVTSIPWLRWGWSRFGKWVDVFCYHSFSVKFQSFKWLYHAVRVQRTLISRNEREKPVCSFLILIDFRQLSLVKSYVIYM